MAQSIAGFVILFIALWLLRAWLSRPQVHVHVHNPEPAAPQQPVIYPVFLPPPGAANEPEWMAADRMSDHLAEMRHYPSTAPGVSDSAINGMISDYYREHPHD